MRPGNAGQVAYWRVDNFYHAMEYFHTAGAQLYRGPGMIEDNQAIYQMWNPFGNLFGLQDSTLESPADNNIANC